MTKGRLLEHGQRGRIRRDRRIAYGTMGRPEQRVLFAADSARAAVPSGELRAGRIRPWAMLEYTAVSFRLDHATFQERANASVRCSGFEAKLLHADRPTGHGQGS